jgi:type II secretory pathway pseudopilin PulG
VELLVVMSIIVLLVTLMVPSLNAFMDRGRATHTRTLLGAIESGLELYRGESALGRDYPPSQYEIDNTGNRSDPQAAYGAETLMWALAGPTLQGTTGIPPPDPATNPPHYGPFIDISRATIRVPPAYSGTRWAILDDFDMPILYFLADPAAVAWDRYRLQDNYVYLRPGIDPLYQTDPDSPPPITDPFPVYIEDQRIRNLSSVPAWGPHNNDRFLLVSAGPDRLYGTQDDICNFPFNLP